MPGGIQFFFFEETPLGRVTLAEYEVYPSEVDTMRRNLEHLVESRNREYPGKTYGYQEYWIKNQPTPGAPFQ